MGREGRVGKGRKDGGRMGGMGRGRNDRGRVERKGGEGWRGKGGMVEGGREKKWKGETDRKREGVRKAGEERMEEKVLRDRRKAGGRK